MGANFNPNLKCGIQINGKDALDYHPSDVAALINSDETGIVRAIFEDKLMSDEDGGIAKPDNYAEHAGRPSLTKVPYMGSENDGYPFLPGHSPTCDGEEYHNGMCKCKYDKWNTRNGISLSEMWPGGPTVDDFDM